MLSAKEIIAKYFPFALLDILLLPFVYPAGFVLKKVREIGVRRLPRCKNALLSVGVFPIRNHYHEPFFDPRQLRSPLSDDRNLPGVDWNTTKQLAFLEGFNFNEELISFPERKQDALTFYYNNGAFESGDAEYWYNLIRALKPKRIFEVGSGYSTLMAVAAIKENAQEDHGYECNHICIEPHENRWLDALNVTVVREKVEEIELGFFSELEENDILFIDSSHVIRPQGDVLFEYLELMPTLSKGVVVHVHDVFTPKDYHEAWVREDVKFWNEQYLLEAFLSHNQQWEILGALNYLKYNYYEKLKAKCPFLTPSREPASFYLRKM